MNYFQMHYEKLLHNNKSPFCHIESEYEVALVYMRSVNPLTFVIGLVLRKR